MSQVLFFAHVPPSPVPATRALPEGFSLEWWRPTWRAPVPTELPGRASAAVWYLFHNLHVFRNREYAVVLVRHDGRVVHGSYVFPGFFRFPFMKTTDLQVGNTWTAPEWRGHGLAAAALCAAVERHAAQARTTWYLTAADNAASVRVAERCGLELHARGTRTAPLGIRLAGAYVPKLP